MINKWFADPEDQNPVFIRMTRNILIFTFIGTLLVILVVSGLVFAESRYPSAVIALSVTAVLEFIALLFNFRGNLLPGKIIIPIALLIAITYTAISINGMHDISMLGFPIAIVVSALLLRKRSLIFITPLTVISIGIVAYTDLSGINTSVGSGLTGVDDLIIAIVVTALMASLLQLLITRLNESVLDARKNEQEQIKANQQLRAFQNELESRVAERTAELQDANLRNEYRVNLFQAIAQIARAIASIRSVDTLLPNIANVISERFGYYHVGIFLMDQNREYAALSATNSDRGKSMMENGYQVKVGQQGPVGFVTSSGSPRIIEDVVKSDFAESSEFPETQSEIVLPLKIGDRVIGALDVHSTQSNAFKEDDITILTTLTDQIAIAIQNAQLLRETETALSESQLLFGNYVSKAWQTASGRDYKPGFRYSGRVTTLEKPLITSDIQKAISEGKIVTKESASGQSSFVVPLKLRDETIGTISINLPHGNPLDEDNVDIIRAASERIALALENATLIEESQRRALKERTIGEISAKISGLVDVENILQTVIQELGTTLPNTDIAVQFNPQNPGLGG
jgi:GAF domain-containing protein